MHCNLKLFLRIACLTICAYCSIPLNPQAPIKLTWSFFFFFTLALTYFYCHTFCMVKMRKLWMKTRCYPSNSFFFFFFYVVIYLYGSQYSHDIYLVNILLTCYCILFIYLHASSHDSSQYSHDIYLVHILLTYYCILFLYLHASLHNIYVYIPHALNVSIL